MESSNVTQNTPAPEALGPGVRFMRHEREVLDRLMPGAEARLRALPMMLLEASVAPGIRLLKDVGLPQLVIPRAHGGLGASAVEVAAVHRALASRSPSLGLAATMHSFVARTLVEYAGRGVAYGADLLSILACGSSFLASGFTEAGPGLRPPEVSLRALPGPDRTWIVSGSKKPCTLARSMDFLSAGVLAIDGGGRLRRAVALIPGHVPGVERRSLGQTAVLAGAETDELLLKNVVVPHDFVFMIDGDDARPGNDLGLESVERRGCLWLELCLGASYVGMASALVERALGKGGQLGATERVALWTDAESAMAAVTGIGVALDAGVADADVDERLAYAVAVRLGAKAMLERTTSKCADLFANGARDPEIAHLLGLSRALAFHPSSRTFGSKAMAAYLDGKALAVA
jgi:alkylation response protein AidB-like acyl-CoA dehydrogenase